VTLPELATLRTCQHRLHRQNHNIEKIQQTHSKEKILAIHIISMVVDFHHPKQNDKTISKDANLF
jgi:hypothetical protein